MAADDNRGVRLDKWLWAARFFKNRSLATAAAKGGRVRVNGARGKPGQSIRPGNLLQITKGEVEFAVLVDAVADRRGPASVAETLYTETAASRSAREQAAAQRRTQRLRAVAPEHRPDGKNRRRLRRLKRGDGD